MCMHTTLEFNNWSYCVILGGTRAESERLGRHDEKILVDDGDFLLNWTFSLDVFDLTKNVWTFREEGPNILLLFYVNIA